MKKLYFVLLAFALFSCSETTVKEANETEETTPPLNPDLVRQAPSRKIGMPQVVEKQHIFSDPTNKDNFRLELTGMNVIDGNVKFTITNPAGKLIYEDTMKAADLEASLVYEMENKTVTQKAREDFILKRMQEFFDSENFSTPAIAPNDNFVPAYGDQITWQAIKNDKNAVGFSYLVGKENGRRIAYSKLKDKVMLVGLFGG